jgi:predicted DNA-binding transcriptional regulator YafY
MELDRLIRMEKHPNCLTFSADWGVSQKTVQRDIDFLRDQMGAPVEYDKKHKGFAYSNDTWMLPAMMLSEGELLAVLMASRVAEQFQGAPVAAQVQKVFEKLAGMLPDKISIRPELLFTRFTFRGVPAKPISDAIWATLVRGVLTQRTVLLRYRTFEGTVQAKGRESRIQPYHIANLQGEWYVFGVHEGHTDVRQFAMARISTARLTFRSFDLPDDFDPETLLDSAFARYAGNGKVFTVRLQFEPGVAKWVTERQWHPKQVVKRRKSGAIELSFPAKGLLEVQRWILSWGRDVEVLAPAELKADVEDEIRAMVCRITGSSQK